MDSLASVAVAHDPRRNVSNMRFKRLKIEICGTYLDGMRL